MRSRFYAFLVSLFLVFPFVAYAMTSSNYQINWDSVNSGGTSSGSSLNYQVHDTIGGQAIGVGVSATYESRAGYRGGDYDATPTAPIISNVVAGSITQNSVVITWTTNKSSNSEVAIGETTDYTTTSTSGSLTSSHSVSISGLTASKLYHFRVASTRQSLTSFSIDYTFTTTGGGSSGCGSACVSAISISNIVVSNISATTATISWDTSVSASNIIYFGETTSYELGSVSGPQSGTSHSIILSNLSPQKSYHFKINSVSSQGASTQSSDQFFVTNSVTSLLISGLVVSQVTTSTAHVAWLTNEVANSVVTYGLTTLYTDTISHPALTVSHDESLTGLLPNTTYHLRVSSTNGNAQTTQSDDQIFTTQGTDILAPANVTNLSASSGNALISLSWINPIDVDFSGVMMLRKIGSYPANPGDGTLVYQGTATTFVDTNLTNGVTYFYAVYAYDVSQNISSGSLANGTPIAPALPGGIQNISLFHATAGDAEVDLTWTNPTSTNFAGVKIIRKQGAIPGTSTDGTTVYDGTSTNSKDFGVQNGVEYWYGAYAYTSSNQFASGVFDRATPAGVVTVVTPTSTITPSSTPIVPVVTPVDSSGSVLPMVVLKTSFSTVDGQLLLSPSATGKIETLSGMSVLLDVSWEGTSSTPDLVTAKIGDTLISLKISSTMPRASGIFSVGSIGDHLVEITATFHQNATVYVGTSSQVLQVVSGGQIVQSNLSVSTDEPIPGARVILFQQINGQLVPVDSSGRVTASDGGYAFIVPQGSYVLHVEKEGFRSVDTSAFVVDGHVVREKISLIAIPVYIEVPPNASPIEAAQVLVKNSLTRAIYTAKIAKEIVQSPEVQKINNETAPVVATVAVVATASSFSLFNLLAYLRFLLAQPLLLFNRRKRKEWGTIYNSLTKVPIELAIVRLMRADQNVVVQTKVTDRMGRYAFVTKPGTYYIDVQKPGFTFPTLYLKDEKEDTNFTDVYHREQITIADAGIITANIPVDPIEKIETPKEVLRNKKMMSLRTVGSFVTVPLAFVACLISPSALNVGLAVVQFGIFILFIRLSRAHKPKEWGSIVDPRITPVSGAVVRIFDKKFNKLLETQVTPSNGRYGFLVGKNTYYVTVEKPGFEKHVSSDLTVESEDTGIVHSQITLKPPTS